MYCTKKYSYFLRGQMHQRFEIALIWASVMQAKAASFSKEWTRKLFTPVGCHYIETLFRYYNSKYRTGIRSSTHRQQALAIRAESVL